MNDSRKNIKAFTLVELLVVMIIAGIILLSITEGFNLLQRVISKKHVQIIENMDICDAYYNLENIIQNADSAAIDNENIVLYSFGEFRSSISNIDSLIIVNFANTDDTILKNASALKLIKSNFVYIADTIAIDIRYQDTASVCWKFTIPVATEKISTINIEEQEKEYNYE